MDTILTRGAITKWYDFDTQKKLAKTIGDTTFSYLTIDKKGKVTETFLKK